MLGRLLLALWFGGLLATLGWIDGAAPLDWRMAPVFFVLCGTGLAVRRSWSHTPSGQLAWNGDAWRWESSSYQTGSTEQELSVIADFQGALLLRLENQTGAGLWLWAEKSGMPERWMDLRRAVYSPHRSRPAARLHDLLAEESARFAGSSSPGVAASQSTPVIKS